MKQMGKVLGAAALVLGGYCLGGATACGSAHAGGAGGDGAGSASGSGEPTVAATVKCGAAGATHAFPGKSVEWIATNVVALVNNPLSGASEIHVLVPSAGMASTQCGEPESVEFLVR